MKTKESFPFLVWTTTLIISPFIMVLIESLYNGTKITKTDLEYIDIFLLVSFIASLPIMIAYCTVFYAIRNKISSPTHLKWILISTCILGIIITFACISINLMVDAAGWLPIAGYSISVIIASFIYKIQGKTQNFETDPLPDIGKEEE